jgi:hypothetical protein
MEVWAYYVHTITLHVGGRNHENVRVDFMPSLSPLVPLGRGSLTCPTIKHLCIYTAHRHPQNRPALHSGRVEERRGVV